MLVKTGLLIAIAIQWVQAGTYTQAQAAAKLSAAGIDVHSSGNCATQSNPSCTSLQGIHQEAIDCNNGVIVLKRVSGCAVQVTGGTEVGHAAGTYSHGNGWKLDVHMTSCLTNYIHNNMHQTDSTHWQAAGGNIYYDEGDHWDITYHEGNPLSCPSG